MDTPGSCSVALESMQSSIQFPEDNQAFQSMEVLALYFKGCKGSAEWMAYGMAVVSLIGVHQVLETVRMWRAKGKRRHTCRKLHALLVVGIIFAFT